MGIWPLPTLPLRLLRRSRASFFASMPRCLYSRASCRFASYSPLNSPGRLRMRCASDCTRDSALRTELTLSRTKSSGRRNTDRMLSTKDTLAQWYHRRYGPASDGGAAREDGGAASLRLVEPVAEHVDVALRRIGDLLDLDRLLADEIRGDDVGPVAPAVQTIGAGTGADAGGLAVDLEVELVVAVDVVHAAHDRELLARGQVLDRVGGVAADVGTAVVLDDRPVGVGEL